MASESTLLRCYFTCTLGEAELLNTTLPPAPYYTINQFIDYLAEKHPERIAIACAVPGTADQSKLTTSYGDQQPRWNVRALSFADVRTLSVTLAQHLNLSDEVTRSEETIALYASSSLIYLIYLLAWLRTDRKVVVISTACTADAVSHLMNACGASRICCDEKHARKLKEFSSISESCIDKGSIVRIAHTSIEDIQRLEALPENGLALALLSSKDIALYGHSSGTSTGLPKPIPITHQDEIGALPRYHQIDAFQRPDSTFSTTPIYTGGLADLWRSWSAGTALWTYAEDSIPITVDNILKYRETAEKWIKQHQDIASAIGYLSCVPFVTQLMSEDEMLLQWMKNMRMVGVGGAAMPTVLGDSLIQKGINLVSRFGSRECGFLLSSDREYDKDKDWQYLRHNPKVNAIQFKNWNGTDFELIVTESWPSLSPAIRKTLPFNSHDVFTPHGSIMNAWKYNGRSDVQITLVTGKKFDPAGIEAALTASEWIKDAVVVGNDRSEPAALIFLSSKCEELETYIRDKNVWSAVSHVNKICPSHARLRQDMISTRPSTEANKIQKSSKGTIMRGKFVEEFKDVIESLYSGEAKQSSAPVLTDLGESERLQELSSIVEHAFGKVMPDYDARFFDIGIDSMMSMRIRNLIRARLPPAFKESIHMDVVYNTGTISRLSDFVGLLGTASPLGTSKPTSRSLSPAQQTQEFLDRIRSERQTDAIATEQGMVQCGIPCATGLARTIILTGATGFLGAHMLEHLSKMNDVDEIVCLVRKDIKGIEIKSALDRVQEVLDSYNLSLQVSKSSRIVCLYSTLHEPDLGLDPTQLSEILPRITHVIHAAWAVNFSLPLQAFDTQIKGLLNLCNWTRQATKGRTRVNVVFVSSTAAVIKAKQPIGENLSKNPADAAPMGYGQSKWVAEALLSDLADGYPNLDAIILRVGQLTANSMTGAWNLKEAWPLMLNAAVNLVGSGDGKAILPDLSTIAGKYLDWLPVDLAAQASIEIALDSARDSKTTTPKIFHLLRTTKSCSTWSEVKSWLADPFFLGINGMNRKFEAEFVAPDRWLDMVEGSGGSSAGRLALSLVPLWRAGWRDSVASSEGDQFVVDGVKQESSTIHKIESAGESTFGKENLLRTWSWILSESSRAEKH